jgi:hypothetical protein
MKGRWEVEGFAEDQPPSDPIQPRAREGAGLQLLSRPHSDGLRAVPLGEILLSEPRMIKVDSGGDVSASLVNVKLQRQSVGWHTDVTITMVDQERMLFRVEPVNLALLRPVRIEIKHMERTSYVSL